MAKSAEKGGPGLAKVRAVPLVRRRRMELVTAFEGRFRAILDAADVMSEGSTRSEGTGAVYYGSTHVLLLPVSRGGMLPDSEIEAIVRVLRADPHLRVRVIRLARREATLRAGAPIGPIMADVTLDVDARGVVIHVEVSAKISSSRLGSSRR